VAPEKLFQCLGSTIGRFQAVVVKEFFPLLQVAQGVNIDAATLIARYAVVRAGVIDPARFVAVGARVDHHPIFKGKEEGVMRILRILRWQILRFFPGYPLAGVFDDAGVFRNGADGKDSFAVNF